MSSRPAPVAPSRTERPTGTVTPLRPLPATPDPQAESRERLIRQLAADRIRDLRDDGLTVAYVARMYDVEEPLLREVVEEELPYRLCG